MEKGKKLGEGAYGVVYVGRLEDQEYAVKRIIAPIESDFFYAVKETQMNVELREYPFIVEIKGIHSKPFNEGFSPPEGEDYRNDKYHLLFERGTCPFSDITHDENLSFDYMQHFMVQMLLGLEVLHRKGIMHRDIKPSNILFFQEQEDDFGIRCVAKLCDFGLAKNSTMQDVNSPSVVTFCYRPPEICMNEPYDHRIDVWSMGCIFYEFVFKEILGFLPPARKKNPAAGEDEITLLRYLENVPLTKEERKKMLAYLKGKKIFNIPPPKHSFKKPFAKEKKKLFEQATESTVDEFFSLLRGMLSWSIDTRFTVSQALDHPFFKNKKEYIEHYRQTYPIQKENPIQYQCMDSSTAYLFREIFWNLIIERKQYDWYNSHRIIFQALDMANRYYYFLKEIKQQEFPTEDQDKYLICKTFIYLAMKYFTSLISIEEFAEIRTPFRIVLDDEEVSKRAEGIETEFLQWTYFRPYRPTLLEYCTEVKYSLYDYLALIYFSTSVSSLHGLAAQEVQDLYLTKFRQPAMKMLKERHGVLDGVEHEFDLIRDSM